MYVFLSGDIHNFRRQILDPNRKARKLKCNFLESNEVFEQIIEKCNLSIAKYKTSKINDNRKNTKEIIYSVRCLLSKLKMYLKLNYSLLSEM